jgi:non-heme chloroperoxidase
MAGGELTTLGNQRSDRLSGLVYLDALGDPRDWPASDPAYRALLDQLPEAMRRSPPPLDRSSFDTYRASQLRGGREKFAFPESELRQIFIANPDGSLGAYKTPGRVHESIGAGQKKPDYSNIKLPVLALFEMPRATHDASLLPGQYQPRNEHERAAIQAFVDATSAYVDRWVKNLKTGVPTAQIVDLPGAGHFVFLTREAEVLREMRTFVGRLQ